MFRWEGQSERETGEKRPAETDSNRYLNGKIVEEVSRKERWRQKRKQSGEVERVTHPSVKSTDTLPHCPSLSLFLSLSKAVCTWVPHLRRQPSHHFPQKAVATSVTHAKTGYACLAVLVTVPKLTFPSVRARV